MSGGARSCEPWTLRDYFTFLTATDENAPERARYEALLALVVKFDPERTTRDGWLDRAPAELVGAFIRLAPRFTELAKQGAVVVPVDLGRGRP